jgi:hypothetical protein
MDRIVSEEMRIRFDRTQIIHAHNDDIAPFRLDDGTQNESPDAAKAIDGNANAHHVLLIAGIERVLPRRQIRQSSVAAPDIPIGKPGFAFSTASMSRARMAFARRRTLTDSAIAVRSLEIVSVMNIGPMARGP